MLATSKNRYKAMYSLHTFSKFQLQISKTVILLYVGVGTLKGPLGLPWCCVFLDEFLIVFWFMILCVLYMATSKNRYKAMYSVHFQNSYFEFHHLRKKREQIQGRRRSTVRIFKVPIANFTTLETEFQLSLFYELILYFISSLHFS